MVRQQSSAFKKFVTFVIPLANDPRIIARCVIDLPPGTCISPTSGVFLGSKCIFSICFTSYSIIHLTKIPNTVSFFVFLNQTCQDQLCSLIKPYEYVL